MDNERDEAPTYHRLGPSSIPLKRKLGMLADRIIVTTDGDHTSVEVIVGLIHAYRRDMLCLNNSVMDTIIICPEAVIIGR